MRAPGRPSHLIPPPNNNQPTPPGGGTGLEPGDRPGDHPGPGGPGNGHGGHHHHDDDCHVIYIYPWNWWGWGWNSYGWGWWVIPDGYTGTVNGPTGVEMTDGQPDEEPAEPPTPIEAARAWMVYGGSEEAAEWYRIHLGDNPEDSRVMREYAAALLETGRTVDAVAMMGYAYSLDPALTSEAIPAELWGNSPRRLRASVVDAVNFGHRSSSGNAWLLVAVLMQAEGRDGVAMKMIERAVGEGLSPEIADRMRLRLTQR